MPVARGGSGGAEAPPPLGSQFHLAKNTESKTDILALFHENLL